MNIHIYREVFHNIYLYKKIYDLVYEIQQHDNSLRYDDIVDVKWMIENKHFGLLREKIKANQLLYYCSGISFKLLFSLLDDSVELFISVFERYRHYLADCYTGGGNKNKNNKRDISLLQEIWKSNNIQVAKYFHQRGYLIHKLPFYVTLQDDTCPEVLEFFLNNGNIFLCHKLLSIFFSDVKKKLYHHDEIIRILQKHSTSLSMHQASARLRTLLLHPKPFLFDYYLPLFPKDLELSFDIEALLPKIKLNQYNLEILFWLYEKKFYCPSSSSKLNQFLKKRSLNGGDSMVEWNNYINQLENQQQFRFLNSTNFINSIKKDQHLLNSKNLFQLWYLDCFQNTQTKTTKNQIFIDTWNEFSDHIRVFPDYIYFSPTKPIPMDLDQEDVESLRDIKEISSHLLDIFCYFANIELISFIGDAGFDAQGIVDAIDIFSNEFMQNLSCYKTKQDFKLIDKLIQAEFIYPFYVLDSCTKYKNLPMFQFFLKKYPPTDPGELFLLFKRGVMDNCPDILNILKTQGFLMTRDVKIKIFKKGPFKNRLQFAKEILIDNSLNDKDTFLEVAIAQNDYPLSKYLLSNFDYPSMAPFKTKLSICYNIPLVDYILKYKNYQDSFCLSTVIQSNNLPFIEYIVKNNLTSIQDPLDNILIRAPILFLIKPFLDDSNHKFLLDSPIIDKKSTLQEIIYLIDQKAFKSIDYLLDFIYSQFGSIQIVEKDDLENLFFSLSIIGYIEKNLDQFENQTWFNQLNEKLQSIYTIIDLANPEIKYENIAAQGLDNQRLK
ncbi:hypothetical protein CYY_000599 [Polysphondylium violaceum]|uniref:Ankyrin repeat-containing protein n=1 Tax=Polysphondylium violaceum TaxID=133409 RepID=A0A8J4Q1A7_9MYCE|nr:hypothetical protein CYY_000599 [Polysphondylium violaceum]